MTGPVIMHSLVRKPFEGKCRPDSIAKRYFAGSCSALVFSRLTAQPLCSHPLLGRVPLRGSHFF